MATHTLTPPHAGGNPPTEVPATTPVTRRTAFALSIGAATAASAGGLNLSPEDARIVSLWREWRDARVAGFAAEARHEDLLYALPERVQYPGLRLPGRPEGRRWVICTEQQIDNVEASSRRHGRLFNLPVSGPEKFEAWRRELRAAIAEAERRQAEAGVPVLRAAADGWWRKADAAADAITAVRSTSPVALAVRLAMAFVTTGPGDLKLDLCWSFILPIARDTAGGTLPLDLATALSKAMGGETDI